MNIEVMVFSASWCAPCKTLHPILDDLALEISDVEFTDVDIDEDPELAAKYSIRSVPTILFFKDGKLIDSLIGLHKESAIKDKINLVKQG